MWEKLHRFYTCMHLYIIWCWTTCHSTPACLLDCLCESEKFCCENSFLSSAILKWHPSWGPCCEKPGSLTHKYTHMYMPPHPTPTLTQTYVYTKLCFLSFFFFLPWTSRDTCCFWSNTEIGSGVCKAVCHIYYSDQTLISVESRMFAN